MTLTQYFSLKDNFAYVASSPDSATKQRRIAELKKRFEQSSFSSGNDADFDFAEYNRQAKAHFGLSDIKNILAKHSVKDSIKQYILQRRSVIERNKKKKAEAEKLRRNGYQST